MSLENQSRNRKDGTTVELLPNLEHRLHSFHS